MPATSPLDVCIVGGGPAGSVAARLLATWGWSVAVLDRPQATPPLAESLPPSTRKLLDLAGLSCEVEAAAFHPNTGNLARWGATDRRSLSPEEGYHVRRDLFDALLRSAARKAGARLVRAAVRSVSPDPVRIDARDDAGREFCAEARYVLDCSGRAGALARLGLRRCPAGYRTLAVAAEWRTRRWPADERTQTLVESYGDGWSWSVPLSDDVRQCTVMIEPRRSKRSLQHLYAEELARTSMIRSRLGEARQTGPAWACDASVYDSVRASDGRALLVGDAASFIEPLSSAGVKKAMLSAWRAAIVVNTCLRDESLQAVAFEYHNDREREVFHSCTRQASVFFAEAAEAHKTPFWSARMQPAADRMDPLPVAGDQDVMTDVRVAQAFERLRTMAHGRLSVSPGVAMARTAAVEGDRIVLRDALQLPGCAHPIRFASNVNLPALVGIIARHGDVPSALTAYRNEINPVTPSDLLRGLSLLIARDAILHESMRP